MDTKTDNPQSQMEQAEGSTENVNPEPPDPSLSGSDAELSGGDANAPMERGAGQVSDPDRPIPARDRDNAGGITNRPLTEEERNQRQLPQRGHAKSEPPKEE